MSQIYPDQSSILTKVVDPKAVLPTRGTLWAAGLDLITHEDVTLNPGETVMLDTGIIYEIPCGAFGLVVPRSSAFKKGATIQGVIDSDYRGTIRVVIRNTGYQPLELKPGMAYAQIIFVPYLTLDPVKVDALTDTDRGQNGFGSTGTTNLAGETK